MATVFSVTAKSGLNIRSGASTSYKVLTAMPYGATCTAVSETPSNGWYKIKYGSTTGWAYATYLKKVSSSTPAASKTAAATPAKTTAVDNTQNTDKASSANAYFDVKAEHRKAIYALGCPPMYGQYTDLQYIDDIAPGVGRVFATTMLSNPTILSLCPGKVDYLPGFSNKTKDSVAEYIANQAKGASDNLSSKITKENKLNGKLFEFKAAYAEYCKVLNLLCRMTAILMGIGDLNYPRTGVKYKNFDYGYITQPDSIGNTNTGNIFTDSVYSIKKGLSTAVEDNNYVHFFITHQGTSVSESMTTNDISSALESIFGDGGELSELARNAEFLMSGTNYKNVDNDIANLLKGEDSWLASFGGIMANYLQGGRLVLPKMIGDVSYDKSISCTCKFVSPYGTRESIFLRCYMPLMCILAMTLPKQIADNMYTYPFLVRAFQKGFFNTDLAIISSLQVTRGGSDDTAWTVDGLSTELEVQFNITPLYSRLMVTSTDNPVLFFKNTSLIEYLGTICGIDMKLNNLQAKKEMITNTLQSKLSPRDAITNSIGRVISDSVEQKISSFLKFSNL